MDWLTDPQIWDVVNYVMNLPYAESGPGATPGPSAPQPIEAQKSRTVGQLD